jgi:O-antigen ligase
MIKVSRSIFFYFAIFYTPFVISASLIDGYEIPKFLLLLAVAGILGIFIVSSKNKTIKMPNIEILIFYTCLGVSSIFAFNPFYSFFGDFSRNTLSLIFLSSIFIFQVVYLNYFSKFNLHLVLLAVGVILGVVSITETNSRIISTIGQPNFLAILFSLSIIVVLKKFVEEDYKIKEKTFLIIMLFFLLTCLLRTGSISGIISLLFACFYLLFEYRTEILIKYKKLSKKSKFIIISTISLALIISIAIYEKSNLIIFEKTKDIKSQLYGQNSLIISDSFNIRAYLFESSNQIWSSNLKNILLGVGPENFVLFFEKYRSNKLDLTSEWDFFFDKPHNFFLQILIEGGLLSLLSLIYLIYKYFKGADNEYKVYVFASLIYFFFNWNFIYHSLIFFLMILNREKIFSIEKNISLNFSIGILSIFLMFSAVLFQYSNTKYLFLQQNIFKDNSELNEIKKNVSKEVLYPAYDEYKSIKLLLGFTNDDLFYYLVEKPTIEIEGLVYFSKKNTEDLKKYIAHLKNKYPKNLAILSKIYEIEIKLLPLESLNTKKDIEKLRPDILEWYEPFIK